MKSIGLALRLWSEDHLGQFPFNVSTNLGGSMELCQRNAEDIDQNALSHFMLMIPENITYQLRTGADIKTGNSSEVMVVCPIHGHILFADGSFRMGKGR